MFDRCTGVISLLFYGFFQMGISQVGGAQNVTVKATPVELVRTASSELQQKIQSLLLSSTSQNTRIIGGNLTDISKLPFMVSIQTLSGQHFCGGAIISNRFVITAAHCAAAIEGQSFNCVVGSTSLGSGEYYRVTTVYVNSKYSEDDYWYDISLLEVNNNFTFGTNVQPISIATSFPSVGTLCTIAGWGTTYEPAEGESAVATLYLRSANVSIIDTNLCSTFYSLISIDFTESQETAFCAGTLNGTKDTCKGDSGGPLICDGYLTGITSFGYGCGRPLFPGVYTNVTHFRNWVYSNIANLSIESKVTSYGSSGSWILTAPPWMNYFLSLGAFMIYVIPALY